MLKCNQCSAPNAEQRTTCYNCGAQLQNTEIPQETNNNRHKIYVVAAILASIILIGAFVYTYNKKPSVATVSTTTTTTTTVIPSNTGVGTNNTVITQPPTTIIVQQNTTLDAEAKSVYDQFCAVDSKLCVGMNYRSYSDDVANLKVSLDKLGRETGGSNHPIYIQLSAVFFEYSFAKDVWQSYLDSNDSNNFISVSGYWDELTQNYGVKVTYIEGKALLYLDEALSNIWERAKIKLNAKKPA